MGQPALREKPHTDMEAVVTSEQILTLADIKHARELTKDVLLPTPVTYSPLISELCDKQVYIKWDNKFRTGAFKERGALNFLLAISPEARARGVCAASAGNHAQALSLHAQRLGVPCTIVMPVIAPLIKVKNTEAKGAKVLLQGDTFDQSYTIAQDIALRERLTFVSAFDHKYIMAGQGTCALELLEQLPDVDAVIASVGGGGLMAGISTAVKSLRPGAFVLGARSDWADLAQRDPDLHRRLAQSTIADGIAVKRVGTLTASVMRQHVDDNVVVSEDEIAEAIIKLLELEKSVVEGAGAAPLAALLKYKFPPHVKKVALVISGSNIDSNLLNRLIERDLVQRGRWLHIVASVPDKPGNLHKITGIVAANGANVLDVAHERFSVSIGMVDVIMLLEVRDREHGERITNAMREMGIKVLDRYCVA